MARVVNPDSLAPPRGYSHGVLLGPGRVLFVAGQVGWDSSGRMVSDEFAAQFAQALRNVLDVVREAGGGPEHVGRLTIYVTDRHEYVRVRSELGRIYRELMGRHYPAMALVEVAGLLAKGCLVEIEATAVIP